MTQSLVSLGIDDGLAVITLDRADRNNAVDEQMADQLAQAAASAVEDPATRAVLLRARGRNFCVGGDVSTFSGDAEVSGAATRLAHRLHGTIRRLATAPVPVVAAVQGAAAGIGLGLAACADLIVAARSASFVMAYSVIGLTPDGGATWLLPRLIGLRRTQVMTYTNRRLSAIEAEDWGLVSEVCDDDALLERSTDLARRLAAGPTSAFAVVKRLLQDSDGSDLSRQLEREACEIGCSLARPDGAEGVAAFLERRQPSFPGR